MIKASSSSISVALLVRRCYSTLTGNKMAMFNEGNSSGDTTMDKRMMSIDIGGMRKPYKDKRDVFLEDDMVAVEPFGLFKSWFDEACKTPGINEANAMCVATATREGKPSARMLLLKGYGKEGFRFFTNYSSRKGQELDENPQASLCFYWEPLMRSVRVEGKVKKLDQQASIDYFNTRPRSSQIGACVSPQSQVIPGRDSLIEKEKQLQEKYKNEEIPIPKPEHWGGFLLVPDCIEFWQGQSNRIHDRICFRKPVKGEVINENVTKKGEEGWVYERLAP